MADDTDEAPQHKLLDVAINDCRANISRHTRASILELLVAVGIISVLALTLVKLGELQGEENNTRKRELAKEVSKSKETYETERRTSARIQDTLVKLEKLTAAATADPKRAVDLVKQNEQLFLLADRASPLREREAISTTDPKAAAQLATNALTIALARAKSSVESQLADEKKEKENYEQLLTEFQRKSPPVFTDTMLYGTGALFVVIIGVFTGLYRFHLREVTKNEQFKLGLQRIRVAANNASIPGFDGEVRTALTRGAFDLPREESVLSRRGRVESPVPGHPSSDLATSLLNRLLEEVEVVLQPKAKGLRE